MNIKLKLHKIISLLLIVCVTFVSLMNPVSVHATVINTYNFNENGINYTLKITNNGLITNGILTSDKDKNIQHIEITKDSVVIKTNIFKEKTSNGNDIFEIVNSSYDLSDLEHYYPKNISKNTDIVIQGRYWNGAVYDKWKGDYYYEWGYNTPPDGTYTKFMVGNVGNTSSIKNYTTLSSDGKTICNNYATSINNCNSSYNKALAILGGTDIALVAGIIVSLFVTVPVAALIALIVSATGASSAGISQAIDSYQYYKDAEALFSQALYAESY